MYHCYLNLSKYLCLTNKCRTGYLVKSFQEVRIKYVTSILKSKELALLFHIPNTWIVILIKRHFFLLSITYILYELCNVVLIKQSVIITFLFEPKERPWKKIQIWKQISNQSNFISLEGGSRGENTCRSGVVLLERGRFDTLGKPSLASYIHFEFLGITMRDQ